jgi:hypothetical protein
MPTVNEISTAVSTASATADRFTSAAYIGLQEIKLNMANILQFVPSIQQVSVDYTPPALNISSAPAAPAAPALPSTPTLPTSNVVALADVTAPVAITLPTRPTTQDITLDVASLLSGLQNTNIGAAPTTTPVSLPAVPVLNGVASLNAAIANEPVLASYVAPSKPILQAIADPAFLNYIDVTPFTPTSSFVGDAVSMVSNLPTSVTASLQTAFDFVPTPIDTDALEAGIREAINNGLSGNGFATSQESLAVKAGEGAMADSIAAAAERAANDFSARGFPAPSGLLLAASRRAANDARREFAQVYANVVSEEARMNRADVATAINSGTQLIDMLNKYHMAILDIAYKVAVSSAEFEYRFFDAVLNVAKAKDDFEQIRLGYAKAELDYNEQQLRAWLAQYEANASIAATNDNIFKVYDAQQKVETLKADLFGIEVNMFKNQLDTNSILLDQYKTVVSARATSLESDRLALDVYKAQLDGVTTVQQRDKLNIDIYSAGIAAEKLNVDKSIAIIDANVKGELAKADLARTQISAYTAEIGAEEAKARIASEQNKVTLQVNEQALQAQKLSSELARLTLLAHEAEVANLLSEYKVSTSTYATALQEASRLDTLSINNQRLALDHAKTTAELSLQSSIANADRAIKMGDLSVGAFKASTEIAARVAGSAMAAHNTVLEVSGKVFG